MEINLLFCAGSNKKKSRHTEICLLSCLYLFNIYRAN